MIDIREVKTRRDRLLFVTWPNALYRKTEQYVPSLIGDEMTNIDPARNPAFEYAAMRFFLAYRDGEIVGRVGGIINRAANEKWGQKRIRLTRLDFIDDPAVSRALIETVEKWGRSEGMEEIVGPVGFCDLDKEGMLVEGFEEPGMFITYYNYPYYVRHMERMGYEKDVDWVESRLYTRLKDEEKIGRLCEYVKKRYRLHVPRIGSKRELKPYIGKLFSLIDREYAGLYGTVPLTEAQVRYYTGQFLALVNLKFIRFVENEQGEVIAFGLAAPALAQAMRKCGGRLFPTGWAQVLRSIYRPQALDLYLIAVDSEYRRTGAGAILIWEVLQEARKMGISYAETGPNLEENQNILGLWNNCEGERNIRRRRSWKKMLL